MHSNNMFNMQTTASAAASVLCPRPGGGSGLMTLPALTVAGGEKPRSAGFRGLKQDGLTAGDLRVGLDT